MKLVSKFFKASAVQIYRDQMMLLLCIAPFLAGTAIKLLVPLLANWLNDLISFRLENYYILIDSMTISLGPMMSGIMTGLLMLDERDEGIITYFSITPFGGNKYLVSRLSIPFAYSIFSSVITMSYATLSSTGLQYFLAPILISSITGVIMSMLMVIAASNKVEGLAISKLLGILLLGIPFAWFGTTTVKVLGALMPTYWMTKMLTAAATDFNVYLLDFAAALLCVFVWIAVMLYIFKRKVR